MAWGDTGSQGLRAYVGFGASIVGRTSGEFVVKISGQNTLLWGLQFLGKGEADEAYGCLVLVDNPSGSALNEVYFQNCILRQNKKLIKYSTPLAAGKVSEVFFDFCTLKQAHMLFDIESSGLCDLFFRNGLLYPSVPPSLLDRESNYIAKISNGPANLHISNSELMHTASQVGGHAGGWAFVIAASKSSLHIADCMTELKQGIYVAPSVSGFFVRVSDNSNGFIGSTDTDSGYSDLVHCAAGSAGVIDFSSLLYRRDSSLNVGTVVPRIALS